MTHLINQLINGEGVCRTAPAKPGLFNILGMFVTVYSLIRLNNSIKLTIKNK